MNLWNWKDTNSGLKDPTQQAKKLIRAIKSENSFSLIGRTESHRRAMSVQVTESQITRSENPEDSLEVMSEPDEEKTIPFLRYVQMRKTSGWTCFSITCMCPCSDPCDLCYFYGNYGSFRVPLVGIRSS